MCVANSYVSKNKKTHFVILVVLLKMEKNWVSRSVTNKIKKEWPEHLNN